ncbi:MAG: AAA family ATPase, partial [Alphaproteobacteria bacterium]|nr:AAA family ATPase [Alphaproteobacteria bacterium]
MAGTTTSTPPGCETDQPNAGVDDLNTHVSRLDLTGFRNYAALRLDVGATPVVLTGQNGAGKTNLLEAISFFAPGRGIRRAPLPAVARLSDG